MRDAFGTGLRRAGKRLRPLLASARAKRALAGAKIAVLALVLAFIVFRLGRIGWGEVLANIPSHPLFYLLFLLRFSLMPLSEAVIYGMLWRRNVWPGFAVFWRKRALNMSFLEASGEAYLALWAAHRFDLPLARTAAGVKDVNILLMIVGNFITALLVLWASASGAFMRAGVAPGLQHTLGAVAGVMALAALAAVLLRRRILHASDAEAAMAAALHAGRIALVAIIVCAQWAMAIRGAPLELWLTFFAIYFAVTRAPFLPAKETVFVSIGLLLAPYVPASEGAVAGMLATWAAMTEIANAVVYVVTTRLDVARRADADPAP